MLDPVLEKVKAEAAADQTITEMRQLLLKKLEKTSFYVLLGFEIFTS